MKNCSNCRYYKEHYVKEATWFLKIGGHCTNLQANSKKWRSERDFWEAVEIRNEERRKAIVETLRDMEQHLAEIIVILKDEKHS